MVKRYSKDKAAILQFQMLAKKFPGGKHLIVDGIFGRSTERVIKNIQKSNGLIADGIVGLKTLNLLLKKLDTVKAFSEAKKYLSDEDIKKAAKTLRVSQAKIRTVIEVETVGGKGFLDNRPIMVFEGHVFWERLEEAGYSPAKLKTSNNKDILYPTWDKAYHKRQYGEWKQLEKAKKINREIALESASWGMFQIMGYHWEALGYRSVDEFVKLMERSEADQLDAFIRFIKRNRLVRSLRIGDWKTFARGYNGPGYKKNDYHARLARADRKYDKIYTLTA